MSTRGQGLLSELMSQEQGDLPFNAQYLTVRFITVEVSGRLSTTNGSAALETMTSSDVLINVMLNVANI